MSVGDRQRGAAADIFLAQQRLAQTRSEIAALILPHRPPPATRAAAMQRARAEVEAEIEAEAAAAARWEAESAPGQPAFRAVGQSIPPSARPSPPLHAARASFADAGTPLAWRPVLRRGLSIWWRHHPAHAVYEVADSMLSHVARRKPWQLLGISAGVGALAMLARPWRLISITGLALAALRMTDVRGLFGSLRDGD